ncbi:MAG: S8 family peptidase [Acidobacteria bacterium]|nr:S8 family peptidase [Acidobacteriota bacterium]
MVLRTAAWALAIMVLAHPAAAAGHRARLSGDLAGHLAVGSQSIRLIMDGTRAEVDAIARRYNLVVRRYLSSGGAVLVVNAGQLDALQQDAAVDHLAGDLLIRASADFAAASMGTDELRAGFEGLPPLSGAGVTVAVIDSGIDDRHEALRRRVVKTVDFLGGDGRDAFGHGTHVAGIIAGQGGTTFETQAYRGIAPGASLINLRVLGEDGSGRVSDVVDAIDWAVAHRRQYRIGVINLSLGAPVLQPYRDDPLCEAAERAWRAGILVVAAAGNYGRDAEGRSVFGGITSPGNSPYALTVGAMDTHGTPERSDDTLASYSSKGPTLYDLVIKPDLAAPGSRIVSAESAGTYLPTRFPELHVAGAGTDAYFRLSGTSMAAAEVSGAAALLLEARPRLRPADARLALQVTSTFVPEVGLLGAGAGSVDAPGAAAVLANRAVSTARRTPLLRILDPTHDQLIASDAHVLRPGEYSGMIAHLVAFTRISDGRQFDVGDTLRSQQDAGDTIVWGQQDIGDTIVWGQNAQDDLITRRQPEPLTCEAGGIPLCASDHH